MKARSDIPTNRTLKLFMALRTGLVVAVLGFLFATAFAIPRAAADPTWTMVETSCTEEFTYSGDCGLTLPITVGEVTGSGTYFEQGGIPPTLLSETGDFSVDLFGYDITSGSLYPLGPLGGSIDIALTDTSAGVTGSADILDPSLGYVIHIIFDGTGFGGSTGTEGGTVLEGCGQTLDGGSCEIGGGLIPEPPSLAVLLAGLAAIAGAFYLARKKAMRP